MVLAGTLGPRCLETREKLYQAALYIEDVLSVAGYRVERQSYEVQGDEVWNLSAEIPGADPAAGILVVGAHYDTVWSTPGADDNASGVAVLLELARSTR